MIQLLTSEINFKIYVQMVNIDIFYFLLYIYIYSYNDTL